MTNLSPQSEQNKPFTGKFQRVNRKLSNDKAHLLICTRPPSQVTRSKTETYLLHVLPDGKRKYLSSLYTTKTPNVYHMEVKGVVYTVQMDTEQATITPCTK